MKSDRKSMTWDELSERVTVFPPLAQRIIHHAYDAGIRRCDVSVLAEGLEVSPETLVDEIEWLYAQNVLEAKPDIRSMWRTCLDVRHWSEWGRA